VSSESDFSPTGKIVWSREVGSGFAAPVVSGGKVILYHRLGAEEICEAMEAETGKTVWRTTVPTNYRDDFGFDEGPRAAPVVAGGRVFTHGAHGVLTAMELNTGKPLWNVSTMTIFNVEKQFFGQASAPLVMGDKVMLQVGGKGGIVAFAAATGKLLWTATTDEAGYASPVEYKNGEAVFFTRTGLVVLDAATGKVRGQMRWRARSNTTVNAATPVIVEDRVFLTSSYETGAVLVDLTKTPLKAVWSGDESLSAHYATPVQKDGFLYGYHGRVEMGPELRCIEMKSGNVKWNTMRFGAGSILLAGGKLVVVREKGDLLIAEATPKGYKKLNEFKILDGTVRAYPALANGTLYVRNEKRLVAVR
jgi:outer membrane protein assembly factor BamB